MARLTIGLVLVLALCASATVAGGFFPIGVWYEGGVGAYRNNLIPEDPKLAAVEYQRDFADMAAHGINMAVVPNTQPNHHKALLDAAGANGVKLIVELDKDGGELGTMVRGGVPVTDQSIKSVLDAKLKPILKHPALWGVQLLDEPNGGSYDRYRAVGEGLKRYAPKLHPFCCLAGTSNVEGFLATAKPEVVAFDFYSVSIHNRIGDPAPMLAFERAAVQSSLAGQKHGVPVWAVLQAHSITGGLRFPTPSEVRCMTYLSLAAGCKGVFWFLYQTEYFNKATNEFMGGLVDESFKGSDRWSEVGKLSREIRKLAPTLANLTPAPEVHVTADCSVHALTDAAGRNYIFAVNTDILAARKATIRLEQTPGKRDAEVVRVPSGQIAPSYMMANTLVWTETLAPGDGALFAVK